MNYWTQRGLKAKAANRKVNIDSKNAIRVLLQQVGYNPTVKYTRKEMHLFQSHIKRNLYAKNGAKMTPKPTKPLNIFAGVKSALKNASECLFKALYATKSMLGDLTLRLIKSGLKKAKNGLFRKHKFRYSIMRKTEDARYYANTEIGMSQVYEFHINYVDATSTKDALKVLKDVIEYWKKCEDFAALKITDLLTNNITYYPRTVL